MLNSQKNFAFLSRPPHHIFNKTSKALGVPIDDDPQTILTSALRVDETPEADIWVS